MKLISGYSKLVRVVKKAKKEIKDTNDALGINVGAIADVAMSYAIEVADLKEASKKEKRIGILAKVIKNKNNKVKELPQKTEQLAEEKE